MKQSYYLFIRDRKNGVWWIRDAATNKRESLGTTNKAEARKLADAKYDGAQDVRFNTSMARTYLEKVNPESVKRTWAGVVDAKISMVKGHTQERWENYKKSKEFKPLLNLVVVETKSDHFLAVLKGCKVSTLVFLQRLHNFALDMGYLLAPVLPKNLWPKIEYGAKRAITLEEHEKIVAREPNEERKKFYQLCWHLGWSQSDVATALASDIDWKDKTIVKDRMKTGVSGGQSIGPELEAVLKSLPQSGHLFPKLCLDHEKWRAKEFNRRCKGLGIEGVTLHSYRYGLAERMAKIGYPERFAMKVLGHNSKAIHRAYARHAFRNAQLPSLEQWEKDNAQIQKAA